MKTLAIVLWLAAPCCVFAQQVQYIVPVFGVGVQGSNATWDSRILINNPQSSNAVVTVSQLIPNVADGCTCLGAASVTVPPRDTRALNDIYLNGQRLRLGAVILTADEPVDIESWIQRTPYGGGPASIEQVKVVSNWLPADAFVWVPRVFGGAVPESTNLFLVNPNTATIVVHYDGPPAPADFAVPPNTSQIERLTYDAMLPGALPQGVRITLSSTDSYYAFTSDGLLIRNAVAASSAR